MHAMRSLHTQLLKSTKIHKTRFDRLFKCAESVASGASLTLTEIGHGTKGQANSKHKVKAVDRLLTNKNILNDRSLIYIELAKQILSSNPAPQILIDWSSCNDRYSQLLRASVAIEGRSITIYEEVFDESEYNQGITHRKFLDSLSLAIPDGCKPIIITDAGYRTDWFKMILERGWNFLGRIRSKVTYYDDLHNDWLPCKDIKKDNEPKYFGSKLITKSNQLLVNLVTYQADSKKKTL